MNINELNIKELDILKIATDALYFNDSSDFRNALWEIVNLISENKIDNCGSELHLEINNILKEKNGGIK
jgi:hypothetical protein